MYEYHVFDLQNYASMEDHDRIVHITQECSFTQTGISKKSNLNSLEIKIF